MKLCMKTFRCFFLYQSQCVCCFCRSPTPPPYAEGPEIAFTRGGQPTAEGRAWMVSRNYKTVVDLRLEDRDNQWTRPLGGGYGTGHTDANRHLEARTGLFCLLGSSVT